MNKKLIIDGIVYEEVTEGNYFIYPANGSFKDDFDKPYQIRVVKEADGSWSTGLQYDDEYVPETLPDYVREVKKRYKGRGKDGEASNRPTCPLCGEDMKVSLEYVKGKAPRRYGVHCNECKHEEWD